MVFLRKSFDSVTEIDDRLLTESELLGIESQDAPISKLLLAIVEQAKGDGISAISFDSHETQSTFGVVYWRHCNGFEPSGECLEAMTIPTNIRRPLLSHALWMINHRAPAFESVRGPFYFLYPQYEIARWPESVPKCRCWLRDPADLTSLIIQLI